MPAGPIAWLEGGCQRTCDLEAEGLGVSTSFEVVEDDGVVLFIQRGLDDRSLAHVYQR